MRNFLLWLRYDGRGFAGWQRQADRRSVQGEMERALARILGQDWRLGSASRTDAGVHGWRHPVTVETGVPVPPEGLMRGLNSVFPRDLAVVGVARVPAGFSARKSCTGKTYCYRILESRVPEPFLEGRVWRVKSRLDCEAMRRAAWHLVGEHDFSAFRSSECDSASTRRLVRAIVVEREGKIVRVTVSGNAFLRNMVRVIAGALVEVGCGRKEPDWVAEVLESGDRGRGGRTAPAGGLYLVGVSYPAELSCEGAHEW